VPKRVAPTVRLAASGHNREARLRQAFAPQVRLAWAAGAAGRQERAFAPSVRLAVAGPATALERGLSAAESAPALLVSYVYLAQFQRSRSKYHFRDWVMDSGAFSAANSGTEIKLDDYIAKCQELLASDDKLSEVFGLDVIGNPTASRRNVEAMWKAGVQAIPTFHVGSPWAELKSLCADYPKIALGGMVGRTAAVKDRFIGEAFSRVWPHRIHGFGIGGERLIMKYPFHSVDATNWEMAPTAFGAWAAYGGAQLSIRGGSQNLRVEVEHYLRIEARARDRWASEWARIEAGKSE